VTVEAIDHVDLVVSSLERSLPFYEGLLRHSGLHTADRYAIGLHHLAFSAASRQTVEKIADRARETGAEIESGPREYDYTPGYYAVFIHDPDGIKLEFVHRPEEGDLALRVSALEARIVELEDGES
jgi:catechol 2,3-dioxygenase-like lactoylglutathione lyase family enzyme